MEIELRDAQEIQAAHDRLLAILLGEVPNPFEYPYSKASLETTASVLCWVLKHEHNQQFGDLIAKIDGYMEVRGMALFDSGDLRARPKN